MCYVLLQSQLSSGPPCRRASSRERNDCRPEKPRLGAFGGLCGVGISLRLLKRMTNLSCESCPAPPTASGWDGGRAERPNIAGDHCPSAGSSPSSRTGSPPCRQDELRGGLGVRRAAGSPRRAPRFSRRRDAPGDPYRKARAGTVQARAPARRHDGGSLRGQAETFRNGPLRPATAARHTRRCTMGTILEREPNWSRVRKAQWTELASSHGRCHHVRIAGPLH